MFNNKLNTTKEHFDKIIWLFSLYQAVMNTGLEFYNWL